MREKKVKVIKAKLLKSSVAKIKKKAAPKREKIVIRKITENITNWIEENRQKKNNPGLSFIIN